MTRVRTTLGCFLLMAALFHATVLAGQVENTPNSPPPPDTHSKISKPDKPGRNQVRGNAPDRLTWYEVVEMMLSNLGLL